MLILGLTGSIGMGKSTTAGFFRAAGVAVHDADAVVHRLYAGEAAPLIEAAFPGVVTDGAVDRAKLGQAVLGRPEALKQLEGIVHPLVHRAEQAFLERARGEGRSIVVLDIPLLLETGGEARVDAVVLVSASAAVQRARVLERPGMTPEKLDAILARQLPDADKRQRAHFIIDTGRGFDAARRQVAGLMRTIAGSRGAN
jgi:dephospho-CoA kinase